MDDIKNPPEKHGIKPQSSDRLSVSNRVVKIRRSEARISSRTPDIGRRKITLSIKLCKPHWISLQLFKKTSERWPWLRDARLRSGLILSVMLIILSEVIAVLQPNFVQHSYALGSAGSLLSPINQVVADKLRLDPNKAMFNFNGDYAASQSSGLMGSATTQIKASAGVDPAKGVSVTDTVNNVDFKLTPDFSLEAGRQDGNRIVYPFVNGSGWVVYSMHGIGVKEDVLLTSSPSDTTSLSYKLELGDNLAAKLERDGSIGVYGNTTLSGNVATATTKDAELLQKARQNAPKNTLLFDIPAPTIKELGSLKTSVKASYSLSGDNLTVSVRGLKNAHYPLTIDPSIYVETAQKFMNGNNETNVDFDVADTLIQKGKTTGARFNSWDPTKDMNAAVWKAGTAVAGGYIYTVGGNNPSGGQVNYTTPGSDTFVVPAGISAVTVKAWGGGGGGGGGGTNNSGIGGNGGGGGFTQTTLAVTPSESLNVYVGGGGGGGNGSTNSGAGGGGGGYSRVARGGTSLIVAAGGAGGGGGGRSAYAGGDGGAGGGTSGVNGGTGANGDGGGDGATSGSGGSGGTGGSNSGANGGSLNGGDGADGRSSNGSDGGANNGGLEGGGNGGQNDVTSRYAGGGGGGGGYYGGGGGSGSTSNQAGGGGGGGSGYTSGAGSTNTAGIGETPGNSADSDRGTAGQGANGGGRRANGNDGTSGVVVVTYVSSVDALATLNWAKFNTSSGTIDNANPGNGTCSGWCTATEYDLPNPRSSMAMVAYNGFLYVIGGESNTCTVANGTGDGGVCKTVYIAKLGANGEPRLWSPTSTDQSTWTYWNRGGDLSTPRSFAGAVAYNNRMYLLGGKTSSGGIPSIVNTMQIADMIPTGVLGSWSSSTALPYNVYGHGVQAYNDRLYIIGGDSSIGGAPLNSVYYNKINSDGTLNSWVQTTGFSMGRMSSGGNITTVWGGYIYISGGCKAVNGSGYCTSVASDTQLASINADGTIDSWNTDASVVDSRIGQNIVAWRGYIYEIGGCSSQSGATGNCVSALNTINYGTINQDGDASTVAASVSTGNSPCSGGDPYDCNTPSPIIGNMLNETAIMNGYLYIMGGCANNACSTESSGVVYQAIGSDGSLRRPATCDGTYSDSYCVSASTLPAALAAGATAVFNGRIYIVGGFNGYSNIYYVSVNHDGSLNGWNSVDSSSIGARDVDYAYAFTRANPAAASTYPGNLYIFGGCLDNSVGCSNYSASVYKCNIDTIGVPSGCTTTGQLQLGTIPAQPQCTPSGAGLGAMAGTVYANYVYLIGGLTPSCSDLTTARYAKVDNNNNIVSAGGSGWIESPNKTATGRRRGAGFGYNGFLYVVGGYDGTSGVLDDIEFAKIDVSDGSLGEWNVSSVTINQRWGLSVAVSNSYAYVVGGCTTGAAPSNCSVRTDVIQTFQVYNNDSGAPAGYSDSSNQFNTDRLGAGAAVYNNYIYIAGGCVSASDCTTATNNVQYAAIDVNGSIGTWSNTTASLPANRAFGKLEVAGGSLYFIGGQSNSATDERAEVYYATPSSGNITTWNTASNGLPAARTQFGASVWNNRIYITGGNNTASTPQTTVYISPQLNSGGNITSAWATSTAFNIARSGQTTVAYANNLYIIGGYDGAHYLSDVQYAQINADGTVGSWSYSTSLPTPIRQGDGFAANGYIYLFGGRSADATCESRTLVAPISANTTIASGNHPTGVGDWYETNQKYTGNRYGVAAAYNEGKAYVLGGACSVPGALTTQISDNFDPGINGSQWTSTGTTAANTNCASVSGNSLYFDGNNRTASTIDGNFSTGGQISFYIYNPTSNTATCNAAESGENINLDYSTNGGGSWTTIGTYTPPTDPMASMTVTIPAAARTNSTRFRWTQVADSGNGFDNWSIDNVDIGAYGAPTFVYTGSDRVVQTTLLSQPQVARYSIMFDTDSDVFPQKWLLNGVDNSIGAHWQLSYRSMTNTTTFCRSPAMTTWGKTTNFGDVKLGLPGVYTPLDGGGVSTNCARFFYLSVGIDSSQAFGYPEDVSRGPTITDLTLEFTADPAKRLMHGRTFVGGLQQPDATPF